MSRGLSPAVLLPTRVDLFRRSFAAPRVPAVNLSLTVKADAQASAQHPRFAFHAMRRSNHGGDRLPDRAPHADRAFLISDGRPDAGAILEHADVHGSAPFLAGAIAQARPSPVLHDPPYRQAAGAYRRSDSLGSAAARPGLRSDETV